MYRNTLFFVEDYWRDCSLWGGDEGYLRIGRLHRTYRIEGRGEGERVKMTDVKRGVWYQLREGREISGLILRFAGILSELPCSIVFG